MKNNHEIHEIIHTEGETLFDRVISILEQARGNVVRAVNSKMVLAYWLIGREIVLELQGGDGEKPGQIYFPIFAKPELSP